MPAHWTTATVTPAFRGRVRCGPGWRLDDTWSERLKDYDLWFVWAGRGTMRTHVGEVRLEPGACLWMTPGGTYLAEQDPKRRLGVTYLHFALLDRRGTPRTDWTVPPLVTTFHDLAYVDAVTTRVTQLPDGPVAATLLRGLLLDLASRHTAGTPQRVPTDEQRAVSELAARIREDPATAPAVTDMAAHIGWSPDHFARVFRTLLGRSPKEYLTAARIERAQTLLRTTGMPVKQIARAVGYRELFYFSRHFKSRTGLPPTEWRARR